MPIAIVPDFFPVRTTDTMVLVNIPDATEPMPEMSSPYSDRPAELDVGDRVAAAQHLGGFLRPRVRRGTSGLVVARTSDGTLRVRFASGRILAVHPDDVTLDIPTP